MHIIRRGSKKSDRIISCTCSDCETLFEFKASEGKFHSDQRDGNCIEIKCPVCDHKCYVNV